MRSHGNPFLSRPQTAGGRSGEPKPSKPFPKPQLEPPKACAPTRAVIFSESSKKCASPAAHAERVREGPERRKAAMVHAIQALKQPP